MLQNNKRKDPGSVPSHLPLKVTKMEYLKNLFPKKKCIPEECELKEILERIEHLNDKNIIDYSGIIKLK